MQSKIYPRRAVCALAAALMLASCAGTDKNAAVEQKPGSTAGGPTSQITGTINYRERLALAPDAVVKVQLLDVSRQDTAATTVASALIPTRELQVPIPFVLAFDPTKIVERNLYAVRAEISNQGALVYSTTSQYPVITRGNPVQVDLMLDRVGQTNPPAVKLWGTAWVLEDLAGAGVVDRIQATLVFSGSGAVSGAVSGNASCNQFRGTATVTTDSLTLSPLAATRKICVEAVSRQETQYLQALRNANRFEIKGEFLYIYTAGQSRPLRFISAAGQ